MKRRKLPEEIPPVYVHYKDEGGVHQICRKRQTTTEYIAHCRQYKLHTTPEERLQRLLTPGWQFVNGKWVYN
jgi:hypothetical protein